MSTKSKKWKLAQVTMMMESRECLCASALLSAGTEYLPPGPALGTTATAAVSVEAAPVPPPPGFGLVSSVEPAPAAPPPVPVPAAAERISAEANSAALSEERARA